MAPRSDFQVAIIGGGLCGISLAIALSERNIAFTIYESHSSFAEIGAGINLNATTLRNLSLISPSLGTKAQALATYNPPPWQDVWMHIRYGAGGPRDGEVVGNLEAKGGSMTFHRQDLLTMLAGEITDIEKHARFKKKLVGYEQDEEGVKMRFADGSEETASILVGCDGIHSAVRKTMFGPESPVNKIMYHGQGAYRAVVPAEKVAKVLGEQPHSTVFIGSNVYFVMYPVNGGKTVNVGAWLWKELDVEQAWKIDGQREQMFEDFKDWGETVHNLLELFEEDTAYWGMHQYKQHPEALFDRRAILIGDGAHAMTPHLGSGAGQGVEDVYVLAEVLSRVAQKEVIPSSRAIKTAFQAVDDIRKPRVFKILEDSDIAFDRWNEIYTKKMEGVEAQNHVKMMRGMLGHIWDVDLVSEAKKAITRQEELIAQSAA